MVPNRCPQVGRIEEHVILPRRKFTDKFIRDVPLPPDGKRHEYSDVDPPQLLLRVSSNGNKSFSLLARFPGYTHPTRRALGAFYDGDPAVLAEPDPTLYDRDSAALSLSEARGKAKYWLGLLSRGRDPGAEKRTAAAFDKVAAQWVRTLSGLRTELEIERLVRNEFVSRWQGRPLASISREEYRLAIREIAERAQFQAHSALGHLRRLLAWAEDSGDFGAFVSPLKDIKPAAWTGAKKEPRRRILNPDELRRVWWTAVDMGYPWGDIIRLLALTGQRLREIADLSWPEIDLDARLITIPGERMKGRCDHELPIAPLALELLQGLQRWSGKYCFSLNGGIRPVGGFDRVKRRLDQISGVTDYRLHDLRRGARSGFSALAGFEDVHREAVLDHKRSGIQRVYDVHNYYSAKLDLLTQWEQRLLSIVEAKEDKTAAAA